MADGGSQKDSKIESKWNQMCEAHLIGFDKETQADRLAWVWGGGEERHLAQPSVAKRSKKREDERSIPNK